MRTCILSFSVSFLSLLIVPTASYAENNQCDIILTSAASQIDLTTRDYAYLNSLYDKSCKSDGQIQANSLNVGAGGYSLGYGSYGSNVSEFCRNYANQRSITDRTMILKKQITDKAFDTYSDCRKFALLGYDVYHKFVDHKVMNITITSTRRSKISLRGLDVPDNVKCYATYEDRENKVSAGDHPIGKGTIIDIADSLVIFCNRSPSDEAGREKQSLYRQAAMSLGLSEGSYSILWPQEEKLPDDVASSIAKNMIKYEDEIKNLHGILDRSGVYVQVTRKLFSPCSSSDLIAVCGNGDSVISSTVAPETDQASIEYMTLTDVMDKNGRRTGIKYNIKNGAGCNRIPTNMVATATCLKLQ